MQILIDETNNLTAYATVGSFENGIDVEIPESVLNDNPLSYRYIEGEFVKNPDYKPPEPPEPPLSTEALQLAVAELGAQREEDNLKNQLAIAELAEILLNGGAGNG